MPRIEDSAVWRSGSVLKRARALNEAAVRFKKAVHDCLADPQLGEKLWLKSAESPADGATGFAVETPLGAVSAVYDHVYRSDHVLGRYTFWLHRNSAKTDADPEAFWSILFNAECMATLAPDSDFEWCFGPESEFASDALQYFLMTLNANLVLQIPRI